MDIQPEDINRDDQETTFLPGPWVRFASSVYQKLPETVIKSASHAIALGPQICSTDESEFVFDDDYYDENDELSDEDRERYEATCRLLAAAPDLYEALTACYLYIEEFLSLATTADDESSEMHRACLLAQKALAKADGEEPRYEPIP